FIHTGKQLSFVYDIADLYKAEITIPLAFQIVADSEERVEAGVRTASRKKFRTAKLMERILPDIDGLLEIDPHAIVDVENYDEDPAFPAPLWSDDEEESI